MVLKFLFQDSLEDGDSCALTEKFNDIEAFKVDLYLVQFGYRIS